MPEKPENRLLLITGPAGAGRSTAIRALEDLGFEAIDNLPLGLLPRLLNGEVLERPLVIGIDTRTRGFVADTLPEIMKAHQGNKADLVYIDCNEETLLRRFSETRRRHPLAPSESLSASILREKDLLMGLETQADFYIDTSDYSPHELKAELGRLFSTETSHELAISVQSFSYKRGTPRGIDMIIDCRFLQNPHWQPELQPLNGKDKAVSEYVKADPLYDPFFTKLCDLCHLLLPAYQNEGKSYFSIGLGCSGGQHRSVCVAENLAKSLVQEGLQVSIRHRELEQKQASLPLTQEAQTP